MVPSRCAASAGAAATTADAPAYLSPEEAKATLSSEQAGDWEACARVLADHEVPEGDIDRLIAKGFAWTSRAHFGPKKANVPPQPDNVMDVLQFLQGELGISPGADLVKVLKAFPEVLSCSIEELLRPNVARFEKEWFMKGPVLVKAIVRKPTLLGLYVDCSTVGSGSCMGQCSKCWSAN